MELVESTSVEKVEERKIMCDLSSWPDHRFLDFKAAALRGQVRIGAGIRDCCFYIPTSGLRNTCGRLRRGQFSPTLFMGCYDIGPCSKIPKREALHGQYFPNILPKSFPPLMPMIHGAEILLEIDVGPSDDTIVERAAIPRKPQVLDFSFLAELIQVHSQPLMNFMASNLVNMVLRKSTRRSPAASQDRVKTAFRDMSNGNAT